jgi:tryptophan synthase alpha chain
MSRLKARLHALRAERRKALAVFLTAGVPTPQATVPLVLALEQAGADLIEIGIPFSDPLADGPVIQQSSTLALRNGITLRHILDIVAAIRKRSGIPIALMGYLNPLLRYGFADFSRRAAAAGVDGMILPEVPLEEQQPYSAVLAQHRLDNILLVTPTSPVSRIRRIDARSQGFLYCVSMTGVTGARIGRIDGRYVQRVTRNAVKNPVLVGFGIAGAADARRYAEFADGVIVGSAFLRRLLVPGGLKTAVRWITTLRTALG